MKARRYQLKEIHSVQKPVKHVNRKSKRNKKKKHFRNGGFFLDKSFLISFYFVGVCLSVELVIHPVGQTQNGWPVIEKGCFYDDGDDDVNEEEKPMHCVIHFKQSFFTADSSSFAFHYHLICCCLIKKTAVSFISPNVSH